MAEMSKEEKKRHNRNQAISRYKGKVTFLPNAAPPFLYQTARRRVDGFPGWQLKRKKALIKPKFASSTGSKQEFQLLLCFHPKLSLTGCWEPCNQLQSLFNSNRHRSRTCLQCKDKHKGLELKTKEVANPVCRITHIRWSSDQLPYKVLFTHQKGFCYFNSSLITTS